MGCRKVNHGAQRNPFGALRSPTEPFGAPSPTEPCGALRSPTEPYGALYAIPPSSTEPYEALRSPLEHYGALRSLTEPYGYLVGAGIPWVLVAAPQCALLPVPFQVPFNPGALYGLPESPIAPLGLPWSL